MTAQFRAARSRARLHKVRPYLERKKKHMQEKLFVGGLSWDTNESSLRAAFEPFGAVVESKIITDRDTGRSRGFGFITMDTPANAAEAIESLDGSDLDGRNIRVSVAENKKPRSERRDRW